MDKRESDIATLAERLVDLVAEEVANALRLPRHGIHMQLLTPILGRPTRRFAALAARFDADTMTLGTAAAARQFVANFVENTRTRGCERVPETGPLIVASNHPGVTDMMALAASLPRDDVKMIVSRAPLIEALPHAGDPETGCFTFASLDPGDRTSALRQMIRRLRSGGAVVLFPSTTLTPDLARMGPDEALPIAETFGSWSASIVLAMQRVPDCRLVPVMVSGVLAPRYADNLLVRAFPVARDKPWQRQRLAEVLQVISQLRGDDTMGLAPCITFGTPVSADDLGDIRDRQAALNAIVDGAVAVLKEHAAAFHGA